MIKKAPFLMIGLPFSIIILYAVLGAAIIGYEKSNVVQESLDLEKKKYDKNFNLTIPYQQDKMELCLKQNQDKIWCHDDLILIDTALPIQDEYYHNWWKYHLESLKGKNNE